MIPLPLPPRESAIFEFLARNNDILRQNLLDLQPRNADYSIRAGARLLLTSPNGTVYSISVSNAGVISATPI